MREDKNITEEVIAEILGKLGINLFEIMKGKSNVSEFKIADKLKITINEARHLLYKLVSHDLVSFTRKKDKKKGWYIYYWTLDENKAGELGIRLKKEKLEGLKRRLEKESTNEYLACPNKCIRLSLESAMDYDFKCPECGSVLEKEKEGHLSRIKKEILEIEEEIKKYGIKKLEEVDKEEKKRVKKETKIKKKIKKKIKIKRIIKKNSNKNKIKAKKKVKKSK